jgi:hypothetical protein
MSELNKEQALHVAKVFEDYFGDFNRIDEYMREQKLNSLAELPFALPGCGPEEDLFSDFTMNPADMDFEIVELEAARWQLYLDIISSHNNLSSPGRNVRLAVLEKKTQKWVGFIRIGSPTIMMKPRNELLNCVITNETETTKSFNRATAMGFVIVPSQPFGYNYLGGKLLAGLCCSHEVRQILDKKYGMNTCLFETTSLYGTTKSVSQYDGMKPYLRFGGVTESDFLPMMHGKPYEDLKNYVEGIVGVFVPEDASSRKLKISNTIIAMAKAALKDHKDDYDSFMNTIQKAKGLTEKKRYYYSNYGFSNFKDVVLGKTDKLVRDKENYDKFHMENIVEWWKKKACSRFTTLQTENRLRNEIEVWTGDKKIDIIR